MFFSADPFGDPFAGFHGGFHERAARRPRNVDTTKLYETLGVGKDASAKDIKKAYRKLAVQHHPDKGGDEHKFKEISAAHEILSDPEKRKVYDAHGLEGLRDDAEGGGGPDVEDIFSMFFGGGGRRRRRRSQDVVQNLPVSLEDLYKGKTLKMEINRQILVGEPRTCPHCNGQGVVVMMRSLGIGMIQRIEQPCESCRGEGVLYSSKREQKKIDVVIEKGMHHKSRVTIDGMADEEPNIETGDLHFVIMLKEHDVFKRKGADLLITKTLSLKEALTGFSWKVTHLDGREILIKSRPGEIIQPLESGNKPFLKLIPNEGMPSLGNPFIKGNLFVLFSVQFPDPGSLSDEAISALREHLPGPSAPDEEAADEDDSCEMVHLECSSANAAFGKGGLNGGRDSTYDSDDDQRPRGVECQQS